MPDPRAPEIPVPVFRPGGWMPHLCVGTHCAVCTYERWRFRIDEVEGKK